MILCRAHFAFYTCAGISREGKTDLQYSSNNYRYVLKHNIVPCTLNSLRLYRHKSGGGKRVHSMYSSSTAVIRFGHNGLSAVNAIGTQLRDPIKS